ncbi:dynamin family protein [Aeromicrobium terrae]|nr:dynamin family protein [Aeromicrobium terrae]
MTATPLSVPERADLLRLLADAAAAASTTDRDDLVDSLKQLSQRVEDPTIRVVVVGQFKQGKSALVNAMVDQSVCPIDDVIGTAVPTVVQYGETPSAVMWSEVDGVEGLQSRSIPIDSLRQHVTEAAESQDGVRPVRVDVYLPNQLLAQGISFIDTPGVGGVTKAHVASTLSMIPVADAVFMLSDASQEYTQPELAFLKQAMTLCPTVSCVLSKTDLHVQWRTIAEANREHLAAAGLDLPLMPASAASHLRAVATNDAALDRESGIPQLKADLTGDLLDRVLTETGQAVGRQVISVVDHLRLPIDSELATLRDPGRSGAVVKSLKESQAAAQALSQKSAKWQQTLSDGSNDWISDMEYDLRDRLRRVGRECEMLIDDCDPSEVWEEIGAWLADSIAQAVADNFVWSHQRAEWLAARVADHFSVEGAVELPSLRFSDTEGVLNPIAGLEALPSGHMSLPQKVILGMRNSYGGILMFGLLTSLSGMPLVNPFSIGAGMLVGGFSYRQDAAARLERRRSMAKVAVRRLIDEAMFQVGKEQRDRFREVKKTLRDHFADMAEHMKRSLQEAIDSAKAGAKSKTEGGRTDRISTLQAREATLAELAERARRLLPPGAANESAVPAGDSEAVVA